MQKVFEKLIERLKEKKDYYYKQIGENDKFPRIQHCLKLQVNAYRNAIEIVNQVAEEYGDGWIPVSSGKLPEEPEVGMQHMEELPEYNVMIKGAVRATTLHYAGDGEWYDCLTQKFYKVIAWQPLPEPYRPKGE